MKPTEEFSKRYAKVERETDAFGRVIGVRRLRPSEQLKVQGLTSDLEGDAVLVGVDQSVPRRMPAIIAASVCEIDGAPITFPKNRGELDAIIDALDAEGMQAAVNASARIIMGDETGGMEAAKNSAGTPPSDSSSGSSKTGSRSTSPSHSTTTNSPHGA